MASILLLCYAEVIAGREKEHSWRLHLEGAASLLSCDSSIWSIYSAIRCRALIARCFVSLVAMAHISGRPPSAVSAAQGLRLIGGGTLTPYLDDFLGYSPDLVYKFCEIGTLISQRAHLVAGKDLLSTRQLDLKSTSLIRELDAMINRAHAVLPAGNQEHIFANESYHHAAILQIQLRVRRLSPADDHVQNTVQRIISLLSRISLHSGPCLGVVLYFPLFTAGCCSTRQADRDRISAMLQQMVQIFRFRNIQRGIEVLKGFWLQWDQYRESTLSTPWETFIDENYDLILY
ncbi:fungal-specific transcription factor domain-containing protein [Aspergillus terricola var. indicus]